MLDTATFDFQPVQDEAAPAFDFQPVQPEAPEPPMPSVRDLMKMSQPWTTRQNASAAIDQAGRLPVAPTLPPAQNRLSIGAPHQGTATQEVERQAGPPLTLQPTAKPTPLAPPPEKQNQITPVPRPALGQPTLPAPQDTEPKQNVTLVSTGFGTGTWIANDNSMEARQQAANLNAAQGEAVRGVTGVAGLPTMASGLKTLVPTATKPYPSGREAMGGAAEVLRGAGQAATPAMIAGAPLVNTPALIGMVGGGAAADIGAKAIADKVHASPEAKALIGEAATLVGGFAGGMAGGMLYGAAKDFSPIEDSLATLLWKRGFVDTSKGQVTIGSEAEARAAAQAILKKNPVSLGDAVKIWRESRSQQPSERIPTGDVEYVSPKMPRTQLRLTGPEPTREEISNAQQATNYAGPNQARAAHMMAKQAEAQVAPAVPSASPEAASRSGLEGARAVQPPVAVAPSKSLSYEQAKSATQTFLTDHGRVSPTLLQRNLKLSFKDAKTVLDRMTDEGILQSDEKGVIYRPAAGAASAIPASEVAHASPQNGNRRAIQPPVVAAPAAQPAPEKVAFDFQPETPAVPFPSRATPTRHGFDPTIPTGVDVGEKVRGEQPPLPRGERRERVRTPEEIETTKLFTQARNELGEDATNEQIDQRMAELRKQGETVTREPEKKFKYGSTQANIPAASEAAQALGQARGRISKSDLMPQGGAVNGGPSADTGLETSPHVTVRYGIQGEDTEKIKQYLASLSPFEASLGKTDKFEPNEHTEGAAVIIAPIEAPELHQINAELEKHGNFIEPTFKEFRPHATIGYVKPEAADRYVGMNVTAGKKFTVDSIAITDRDGRQELIKLEGKGAPEQKFDFQPEETIAPKAETKPSERETLTPAQERFDRAQAAAPKKLSSRKQAERNEALLREVYKPGNVVKSYGHAHDKVLEFLPGIPGAPYPRNSWQVKVIESDAQGNPVPGAKPRIHSTPPEKSEIAAAAKRIDAVSAAAKAEALDFDFQPEEKVAPKAPSESKITAEAPSESRENQSEGTARGPEEISGVSSAPRQGGAARTPVPTNGKPSAQEGGDVRRGDRQSNGERLEQPGGLPSEGNEPARGGGSRARKHPATQRAGGGTSPSGSTGADGRRVEAPTPEEPEEAHTTAAELRNQRNYRISDEEAAAIGTGGEKSKIKGNLDALETFKTIQKEGRETATPEEQKTLAKYVDFGGLVGMLERPYDYTEHYQRFTKILTPEEIKEIKETLPNTHYTSMEVVDWAWKALQRLGFKGGRWMEPGMGIGNFVGRVPEKIAQRSEIYGVERNPLTGGMAKLLYPDAKIQVKPFQQFVVPNNSFDAAIGNVPFQDVTINDDPAYRDLKLNLHNYFILKTLDKLKPGGIAALITSRYTLDSGTGPGYRAREEMAKRADLLAAIRLPDSAFKGNARTEVVADLLIFQKRDPSAVLGKMPDWTATVPLKVGEQTYTINKHIANNPDRVLGQHSDQGSMYRANTYTVKAPKDFSAALEKAIDLIPRNVFGKIKTKTSDTAPAPSTLEPEGIQFAPEDVKPGAFFRDAKGAIKIKESGVAKDLPEGMRPKAAQDHLGAAIDLRDQVNRTIAIQLQTSDDEPLKAAQAELEKLYKGYEKKYGNLHSPLLAKIFKHDPEYGKLLALENVDTETKEIARAAIFTKRVLAPYEPLRDLPDEPKSAMLKVMAERGYLDTALMADLLKKPEADVARNLEKEGLIFQDPQSGNYHPADEYLSGNVREKLKVAEQARETDPKYERNVEALKKVQPKPLTIHEIQPNLGQTWIPMKIYKGFVAHLAKTTDISVNISRDTTGRWLVQAEGNKFKLEHEWQGGDIPGHKLVQYALNQQQPTVYDTVDDKRVFNPQKTSAARDKLAMIKEEFTAVLRRANQQIIDNLEQIYNDTFNGHKLREFSGEHLDFPGMSEEWRGMIRGYQKAAVWRLLQEGRGGIFHAPGLGKTLTMATTGMEARRLKLSRKNMYAVPNHMVPQWREDFKRFYPNANVLAVTDDDFTPVNRAQLMSRIATGDWDAVIVPHSQFDLLPMSPEWEKKSIDKRLAEYREVLEGLDEERDKRTIKQIEKAVDKLESRLHELNAKQKDNTISFDQMGVDMLFVDEAHAYKTMAVPTKMGNIGGISNAASQRAFALEMKANFLRDTHKGRGLVFGTGTPITNTVGELYVMTKYLAPEMLEQAGIRSFDDWAANFAQTITQWEYAPDGITFKPKTTLSEFVNVPELSTMFRRFAEYLSKESARQLSNLKEPNAKRKDHMVTITGAQEPLLDMIAARGEHLIKNPPKTKEERQADNWLKLSGDARKISLDARLYDPDLPDEPDSKANQAVRVIRDILDRTKSEKGTVAVFSDFFQHKNDAGRPDFNLFEDIKQKLIREGVPASEIALIHDVGDDKDKKELLFSRVRSGKVRVIFGSTEKMGIGTNIQSKLKGELHLDQPWRPDQVEQREGRIVRSGNMWDEVEIHRFIAEPQEGNVLKWDDQGVVKPAYILGEGDKKPAHYDRTTLSDGRVLVTRTNILPKSDVQEAIEAGKLQELLDMPPGPYGGEVEKPRPRAYDLQMYQQLARKANFQEQFLTGNYSGRSMEDVGGDVKLNSQMFQLGKAMATGNPDALRKMKVEHDLRTYSMLERNFKVERSKSQREQSNMEYRIPLLEKKIKKYDRDIATWEAATKGEGEKDYAGVPVVIGDKTYQGDSLKEWLDTDPPIASLVGVPITIGGLPTELEDRQTQYFHESTKKYETATIFEYRLAGEAHDVPYNELKRTTPVRSLINSFTLRARQLSQRRFSADLELKKTREDLVSIGQELKRTSPYAAKVEGMEKELGEINTRLGIKGPADKDEGAVQSEEPEKAEPKPVEAKAAPPAENPITGESGSFTPSAEKTETPGPGAKNVSTGNETGTNSIQDLTDSIRRQVPSRRPLKDRINMAGEIGEKAESAKTSFGRAFGRIKGTTAALWDAYSRPPKWSDYEDATGKWSGADQVNAVDLERFTNAIKAAVPAKLRREAISNWIEAGGDEAVLRARAEQSKAPYKAGYEAALKLTNAEQTIARNVMNRNDATLAEAQKAGLLQQGVENYVRHVYADSPKYQARIAAEMNFASLQTKPSFTKQRVLPTYFDAEQLGFTPKDKDVGYLTAIHERSFREALAARAYIRALMDGKAADGRPLVITSWASAKELPAREGESSSAYLIQPNIKPEEEFGDYRKVDHPALRGWRWAGKTAEGESIFVQGDALVHPEIFRKVKNNLTKSAIRSYEMDVLGHTVHPGAFVLNASAEIKHAILSFSGFHQTTLAMHAAEHRTLPAGMPKLDLNEPKQRGLVEHGLMVAQYDAEEAFGEGVASGGLVTKIPGIGPLYGHYVNYLFHDYLPRIKMAASLNGLERNFQRYGDNLTPDQIYAITAAQGNASFGGLNYRMLGRNKTIQDVLRLGLMAPDFFEARARYAGQAAKSYGREQLVALLGGALVLYTIARILNEITDRDPHWDKPFGVVYRDKEYTMRPIQEDIIRAVTTPGKYFMARLSPLVSTAIHLGEGRNEFGRKETIGEVAKNAGKQEVPIPLQPWTRESKDSNAQKAVETIAKMVGVNVRNAHEASEEHLRDREREGRELEKELRDAQATGDQETIDKIESNPETPRIFTEHEAWRGYLEELRRMDHDIKDVQLAHNISAEDRRARLDSLREARKELLRQSDETAKQMAAAH